VKKTTRTKRGAHGKTGARRPVSAAGSFDRPSYNAESELLVQLRNLVGVWTNYFHNLPAGPAKSRALAAARTLKAVLDCHAADSPSALDALGRNSKRTLQEVANDYFARNETFMVDLTQRDTQGWHHPLGDIYSEKGDADWHGRASHVRMRVNALRWFQERGVLNDESFTSTIELFLTGRFVDVSDLLTDARLLSGQGAELEQARERARAAYKKWERSQNSDDLTALFRAGLRAFGVDRTKADNLFAAEVQQSRRATRKRAQRLRLVRS
jgi:hypothetical protein